MSRAAPVSIEGVLLLDRRVVLVKNARNEWELPGGRPRQSTMELKRTIRRATLAAAIFWLVNVQAVAQPPAADSAAVAATVRAFQQALAAGDSAGALRLLAADAVILEGGARETRDEYAKHHLPEDIEFARVVPIQQGPLQVTVSGDVAWASSTSVIQGTYRNQPIDSAGVELMVLTRTATGWEIRAIHWSSQAR